MSAHLRSMLGTLHPGGVILFKRNIADAAQTHALLREAQRIVGDSQCFAAWTWKAAPSIVFAMSSRRFLGRRRCCNRISETLSQAREADWPATSCAGIQHRLRAVCRLALRGIEERVGSRTVSADPHETVRYAREFLGGLRDAGILGCGKHFPGIGRRAASTAITLCRRSARTWDASVERRPGSLSRDAQGILLS